VALNPTPHPQGTTPKKKKAAFDQARLFVAPQSFRAADICAGGMNHLVWGSLHTPVTNAAY
jgi:hypothetical protein